MSFRLSMNLALQMTVKVMYWTKPRKFQSKDYYEVKIRQTNASSIC